MIGAREACEGVFIIDAFNVHLHAVLFLDARCDQLMACLHAFGKLKFILELPESM